MKTFITVLILLISACATSVRQPEPPQGDFDYVCEQVVNIYPHVTCTGVEPPQIIMTRLPSAIYAYGVYVPGEPYVFVDPNGTHVPITIIHEVTHYVLYETGALINRSDRCKSEEIARFVAGQLGDKWRIRYGCPK